MDPKAVTRIDRQADGEAVEAGAPVLFIRGHARGMLSAERVALNFMQHLSGIATLTAQFVAAVRGTSAKILDTRKTLPGWRALEKYAVRCGGGQNHRMDLASAVLIKDNHLAAVDGDVGPGDHAGARRWRRRTRGSRSSATRSRRSRRRSRTTPTSSCSTT